MARDSEYELLLSKYNVSIAKTQDLQEQIRIKEGAWKAKEAHYKHVDKLTRELCEKILARDRNEMVLGREYSWAKLDTEDLVLKADASYRTYNANRSELLQKIMDVAETRRAQIESLEDQIRQMIANGTAGVSDVQEVLDRAEREAAEEQAKEHVPNRIRDVAAAGKVELIIEDADDVMVEGEKKLVAELVEINEQARVTANSVPVVQATQNREIIKAARDQSIMTHLVDLSEYEARFNDVMWEVMKAIGAEGLSKYPDIEAEILRNTEFRTSKIRTATLEIAKMGALNQSILNLPLTPKVFAYQLSDIGTRLYKKHFEKEPVISDIERIIAEHDNAEHGFGILDVETVLKESGAYRDITSFNRKRAVRLQDGKLYVPDLICFTDRYREYMEYERGMHTQTDFNAKCNKMTQVTRFLNFVTPNKAAIKRVRVQIDTWIGTRGATSLRNIKIRLTTAQSLRGNNPRSDDAWMIIYDIKRGTAPIKCLE